MSDKAVTIIGLVVEQLRAFFGPDAAVQPLGGGTDVVRILAGDVATPPPWLGSEQDDCTGCDPFLWVRLVRRWRTGNFPQETPSAVCGAARVVTVEAGIARCYPITDDPTEQEQHALIQLDDSWRIDNALCLAMRKAENTDVALSTTIGAGEPIGPEGLVLLWVQQAHAQLAK
ncbi:hypothetical protein [Nocardia cyriacigeorgica]|uniref:hypothetical protein n=1 Tax=Nocardia cyriacigeorgica TaxID=135487 RepID=UPI002454F121|nr:hypothetical protein [Nocardia cyriacigeorgica]